MSENVSKIEEVKEELNEVAEDLVTQAEVTPQTQVANELSTKEKIVQTIVAVRPVVKRLLIITCLLYTSPSPRDRQKSRMPSSA